MHEIDLFISDKCRRIHKFVWQYIELLQDETYDFFYIMPTESSTLEKMRTELTGDQLVSLLNSTDKMRIDVCFGCHLPLV